MAILRLILANIFYKRSRAIFTIGSVMVAFLLFGLLLPIDRVFNSRVQFADANRLVVINRTSMLRPLPVSYGERISKTDGVDLVGHYTYFGAFYRDPSHPVPAIAAEAGKFQKMVDEIVFKDPAAYAKWASDPASVAVGRQLADKYSWKVGDLVPIYSTIYQRTDGSPVWTFKIDTIYDSTGKDGNTNSMVINYNYFDDARAVGKGTVGWYVVRIHDSRQAGAIAKAIDSQFANSPSQTSTTTEKAFAQSFLRQIGDFGAMITAALTLVFYTVTLVTANTMAQSVRERFSDIGVLKTIGYTDTRIFGIVLGESLTILLLGGCLGLLIAAIAIPQIASRTDQLLSALQFSWLDCAKAIGLMFGIGVLVSIIPAWGAARQDIVQALGEAV